MDVKYILHANKEGDMAYAKNSSYQKNIISIANSRVSESLENFLKETHPTTMGIADLGCASGSNTLTVIGNIVRTICTICIQNGIEVPELSVTLNDLTNNDFNGIFTSLPEFYNLLKRGTGIGSDNCFVSCTSGSFYGRLFPKNSLHFVHSSLSLHWISQVPEGLLVSRESECMNEGRIYISKTSSDYVVKSYVSQFKKDFGTFLRSRAEEVVMAGRMVLYCFGRNSSDPTAEIATYRFDSYARALNSMASQGLIEKEKIDSFNIPFYFPCVEEVKNVIEEEGSFHVDTLETIEVSRENDLVDNGMSLGNHVSNTYRTTFECLFKEHFGSEFVDEFFSRLAKIIDDDFISGRLLSPCIMLVSVTRR